MCRIAPVMQSCQAVLGDAGLDAADDAADATDSDNDRVLDADDNCKQTPNTLQENEDADALGDACDPCPIFVTWGPGNSLDANIDGDGDGVGDGCDPNPNQNTERALLFEGFNAMPTNTVQTGVANAITYSGGRATAGVTGNETASLAFIVPGFDSSRQIYVFTRETPLAYSVVTLMASGAALFTDPSAGAGFACGPGRVGSSGQLALMQFNASGDNQLGAATADTSVGAAFDSLLHGAASSAVLDCTSPSVGGFSGSSTLLPTAVGIHVRSMSAAFHYLYVVDTP